MKFDLASRVKTAERSERIIRKKIIERFRLAINPTFRFRVLQLTTNALGHYINNALL